MDASQKNSTRESKLMIRCENIIVCGFVCKIKYSSHGTINRYKVELVPKLLVR